jgi:hypothetical protein
MVKRKTLFRILLVNVIFLIFACQHSTEPGKTVNLSGTVYPVQTDAPAIHPAYLFRGDSLMAVTDKAGHYNIASIESGTHVFICSALGYSDTTVQVTVGRDDSVHDFQLTPDQSKGRVYGEFQDQFLWDLVLSDDPDKGGWNSKEVRDGMTGATLCAKILQVYPEDLPDRMVFIGDSLLAYDDGWGQFWFEIQCGTYPLTGVCEGYRSDTRTVKIVPYTPPESEKSYVIFFMNRLEK